MPGGLGKIITDHKPAPSSAAEEKATKAHQEEIVKELAPAVKKNPVGRPRKNSTEDGAAPRAQSKSPSRRALNVDLPQVPPKTGQEQVTAEEAARRIGNHSVVRQLRMYARRFPQFAPPPGYNPHLYSPEQNRAVIKEIKEAVKAEVEFLTAPSLITDGLVQAETAATFWAASHPENPAAAIIGNFQTASNALLSDPAVNLDIGLLECEISGFMPDSALLRLAINAGRVLLGVWNTNRAATASVGGQDRASQFKDF